ncbi:MAG: ACT domain-containing protein, partial [Barnesiella sp.]
FINARCSVKQGSHYVTVLRVVGNDDIGIVTNITSIISKEKNVAMRSISIDSNDGLFQGHITVTVNDLSALNGLIKKLKTVKGVKDVQRGSI